jgi:S-formylglutathione hydrolase FrmB
MLGTHRVALAATLGLLIAARYGHAADGSVVMEEIDSPAVATNRVGITSLRRVSVYLPAGYDASKRSYPTLYWIPGWQTPASREYVPQLDAAIAARRIAPVIVVHLDVREGVFMMNSRVFGHWADFVAEELVPFIDRKYRTVPDPRGRALMGHSSGGYAALLLPLRYPGVWDAVGVNDASVWAGCVESMPYRMPEHFTEYQSLPSYAQAWTQIAIAISPNERSPRLYDTPRGGPEAAATRALWDAHCLWRPETAAANAAAFAQMSKIAIVIPLKVVSTNRIYNQLLTRAFDHTGVPYVALEMPGTHGGDRPNRFIALAEEILPTLRQGYPTAVGARAETWAAIKRGR